MGMQSEIHSIGIEQELTAMWSSPCSMKLLQKSTKKVVDLISEFCQARFQTGRLCGQSPVILFCYSMCACERSQSYLGLFPWHTS